MEILDRINALTVEQLEELSKRDDAGGVLASYRLAKLQGLPCPDREAVIVGDDFVIVAQNGAIKKIAVDSVTKLLREGSFVSWNSSGGTARGQIEYVMEEGVLGIPESDFSINAEPDDPAVLIRVWHEGANGWAETETLVGHKMSTLSSIDALMEMSKETFKPPQGVRDAAQRALDWVAEGFAGGGFSDVGRARAAQLARGDAVSEDVIRRISSYLARHAVDSQATGFSSGEDGFPSPGRVAWDAWGGDPAVAWANSIVERLDREAEKAACPLATHDVPTNLKNRQSAIDGAAYGPLNPALPNKDFWNVKAERWSVTIDDAKKSRCGNCAAFIQTKEMLDCIETGLASQDSAANAWDVVQAGDLGYCEAFDFKCAASRTCDAWITGGPVKATFLSKEASQRFTLGPLYVPDFMDAHGEWTDAQELQNAAWGWVQKGDRTIYLQHDREVRAGEWVEMMTMPQPWTVKMQDGVGKDLGEVTYPAGTVFLGVIWDEGPWQQIKRGHLRGYSIGGLSNRVLADLPEDASREGIEADA